MHLALSPPDIATPAQIQPIKQLASVLESGDRFNAYAADDHWIYAVAAKTQS